MAETFFPFDTGVGSNVTEAQWYAMARFFVTTGTFFGELTPSANGSGMKVTVGTGRAWVEGHYYNNDTNLDTTIAVASSSLRYDRVFVKLDRTAKTIGLYYRQGTPGTNAPPALNQNTNVWEMPICVVKVAVGAVVINAADVIDERVYAQAPNALPAGSIIEWPGAVETGMWKFPDGRTMHRWTYAALFANVGTTWGNGSGDGLTFTMPDHRGRSPMGAGTGTALTARALAALLGEENHVSTVAEMPGHTHQHHHRFGGNERQPLFTTNAGVTTTGTGGQQVTWASMDDDATATGGGQGHNTVHPVIVTNFLLKCF